MKKVNIFALFLFVSATNSANAEVTSSSENVVFSGNTGLTKTISIKNRYTNQEGGDPAAITITAENFTISNQTANAGVIYTVDTSDCIGSLNKSNACTVTIDYLPSTSLESQLLQFSDPLSSNVLPIYLTNYYQEPADYEASRRLSPVIEDVKVSNSQGTQLDDNQLFDHASEDQDYTVTWTVLTYEPLVAQAYLFDCATATKDCAAKTTNANGKIDNTTAIVGTTLTSEEVAAAGFEDYSFRGQNAIHQTFTGTLTINPGDFNDETAHSLALRFYHRTSTDSQRQFFTGVSTSLSGNLNFLGQQDSGYFDTNGRALVLSGNNGL